MVGLSIAVAVVLTTVGPRRDVDFFWHVLLGQSLLDGATEQGAWTSWVGDPTWRTAQPLAEIGLAMADARWGTVAPTMVRALTAAAALAALLAVTRPGTADVGLVRASRWLAFGAGAMVIMGFTQERPAQIGLIAMPLVGAAVAWWVLPDAPGGRRPRGGLLAATVVAASIAGALVWIGSHQSWALGWLILLCAVGLSPREPRVRLLGLGGLLAVLAVASWRHGPPWHVAATASAAADLVEWQPTDFAALPATPAVALVLGFSALIATVLVASKTSVAHSKPVNRDRRAEHSLIRPSMRSGVAVGVVLSILGVASATAWRHLPLAVLAAAPLLVASARWIATPYPAMPVSTKTHGCSTDRDQLGRCGPIEAHRSNSLGESVVDHSGRRRLAIVFGTCLALSAAVCAVHGWERRYPAAPTDSDLVAAMAATHSCRTGTRVTFATTYNDSGAALSGARSPDCGPAGSARIVIDGRTDRYGIDTIRRWHNVVRTEGTQWWLDFLRAEVDIALLPAEVPLTSELHARGWPIAQQCADYVVLYHPRIPPPQAEVSCPWT